MTQKEIDKAKKKAKECLEMFSINVPMTKMANVAYGKKNDGWSVLFIDVRTKDVYSCTHYSNVYYVYVKYYNTGKKITYTRKELEND